MSDPTLPSFRYRLEQQPPARSGRLPRMSCRSRPHCPPPCWRSSREPCVSFIGTHADEWQYYLEGAAEMGIYLGIGHPVTEQFGMGDIGYVPMGAGHHIRNTGSGILRLLLGFNNGHYHSHDLSAWVASNSPDLLAANLGLPRTVADALPKDTLFIARSLA
jgi:hypothetical protein